MEKELSCKEILVLIFFRAKQTVIDELMQLINTDFAETLKIIDGLTKKGFLRYENNIQISTTEEGGQELEKRGMGIDLCELYKAKSGLLSESVAMQCDEVYVPLRFSRKFSGY